MTQNSELPFLYFALLSLVTLAVADEVDCGHETWNVIRANRDNLTFLNDVHAPAWVGESQLRGTFSILQTCILTLFACVYTALHLNVPENPNLWSVFVAKLKWIFLALFVPEFVLFEAASQFSMAWGFSKKLRKLWNEADAAKSNADVDFGMAYAFFVVMGGLQIDFEHLVDLISHEDMDRRWGNLTERDGQAEQTTLQITPEGVLQLARFGHWAPIKPQRIRDRSKADGFQKAVVLLQVSWMVVSCVARKVYGLPLTLLEIHVMVHVACAAGMYMFWFKKPLDIRDPEILPWSEGLKPALAYMTQKTFYNSQCRHLSVRHVEDGSSKYFKWHVLPPPRLDMVRVRKRWDLTLQASTTLGLSDQELIRDLAHFQDRDEAINFSSFCYTTNAGLGFGFSDDYGFSGRLGFDRTMALGIVLPLIYGGIHLSAWNFGFPSFAEHLMWKISCIGTMTGMPVVIMLFYWGHVGGLTEFMAVVTLVLVLLFHAVCRVYIVVEAFISLRVTPIGAFWIPAWLQSFPHV